MYNYTGKWTSEATAAVKPEVFDAMSPASPFSGYWSAGGQDALATLNKIAKAGLGAPPGTNQDAI